MQAASCPVKVGGLQNQERQLRADCATATDLGCLSMIEPSSFGIAELKHRRIVAFSRQPARVMLQSRKSFVLTHLYSLARVRIARVIGSRPRSKRVTAYPSLPYGGKDFGAWSAKSSEGFCVGRTWQKLFKIRSRSFGVRLRRRSRDYLFRNRRRAWQWRVHAATASSCWVHAFATRAGTDVRKL